MHLKSLELTGFKSFAEGKIEFPQGVTAVVGPNGSGKSNVVDAILWVLGEQSTKTLRSERMEDVIFNGTETRKPLGMVEVSLIMSGVAGEQLQGQGQAIPALPNQLGDYHEVMITRRLYRNGDSEYLINKTLCRLKDVRSLFLDTRAGTKGHTVIEQGRIEQILNASPQDRRELIEETAGIVRYKKQKAEALRKLDSTHQSLLRVRDIIAEVERQLSSLERQARQARAYQGLHEEAKTLEIRLLVKDYRVRVADQATVESGLAELDVMESAHAAEQARLHTDLEAVRLRMIEAEQAMAGIREEVERLERLKGQALTATEVERTKLEQFERTRIQAQADLARFKEEGEQAGQAMMVLRTRLAEMDAEIAADAKTLAELEATAGAIASRRTAAVQEEEQARQASMDSLLQATREENVLAEGQRRLEEAVRRADRLDRERSEAEVQREQVRERLAGTVKNREDLQRALHAHQQERDAAVRSVQQLEEAGREIEQLISRQQEDLAATSSRLRALQGVIREQMGYGRDGEEATSLRAVCQGLRQAVAEWLVVPRGMDRAVDAVLGDRARGWLVEGPTAARDAVAFLKQKGLGRGAFVPTVPRWATKTDRAASDWWQAIKTQPGVVGLAQDLLSASGDGRQAMACLFDSVVIVESLDAAMALWEQGLWSAPDGPTLVTLDGEVLDPSGIITGGLSGESGGLLQRQRETLELEARAQELTRQLDGYRAKREQIAADRQVGQAQVDRLHDQLRDADMRMLAAAKDETSLTESLVELDRRLETVVAERQAEQEEQGRIDADMRSARERLAQLVEAKTSREARLAELHQTRLMLDTESQTLQQQMLDARVAFSSRRSQRDHGQTELARFTREDEQRRGRVGELDRQLSTVDEGIATSQAERQRNETLCQELTGRIDGVRQDLIAAQTGQAQDGERAKHLEGGLDAERAALAASREARTGLEVRRAEIKTHLAQLEASLRETYQLSVEAALAQEPAPEPALDLSEQGQETGEADPSVEWRERLQKIRGRIERMGPINLAAIEEHRELEERHTFLVTQEADLAQSISALKEIISKINRTTKQMFLETFNELQQKFGEVFGRFFPGGRAELILTEPEPGAEGEGTGGSEPGVDIAAQPPGKRLKSITMLSGGEKTLTAMALIFASFLIRPTPFCILDEIDAPLDEENIGRFTGVLRELSDRAQFIVITHNKRTMAVADSLFGVTMEEPGMSKLVSVRLTDLQPA